MIYLHLLDAVIPHLLGFNYSTLPPRDIPPKVSSWNLCLCLPMAKGDKWPIFTTIQEILVAMETYIEIMDDICDDPGLFSTFFSKVIKVFKQRDRVIFQLKATPVSEYLSEQLANMALLIRDSNLIGISREKLIELFQDTIKFDIDDLVQASLLRDNRKPTAESIIQAHLLKPKGDIDRPTSKLSASAVKLKTSRPAAKSKAPTQSTHSTQSSTTPSISPPAVSSVAPFCLNDMAFNLKVSTVPCSILSCKFLHTMIPSPVTTAWKTRAEVALTNVKTPAFATRLRTAIDALP